LYNFLSTDRKRWDRRYFLLGGLVLLSIKVVAYFSTVSTTIPLPDVTQFPTNRHSSPFEGWRDKKLTEKFKFGHVITLGYTGQQIAGVRGVVLTAVLDCFFWSTYEDSGTIHKWVMPCTFI